MAGKQKSRSFWRHEVIEPILDDMTERHLEEQKEWLRREPVNPRPWYHAAQICRTQGKRQEALGMLLEAVRLDPEFAAAHLSLAEIYAVQADYRAAWRHARAAECAGDTRGVELLRRYDLAE